MDDAFMRFIESLSIESALDTRLAGEILYSKIKEIEEDEAYEYIEEYEDIEDYVEEFEEG